MIIIKCCAETPGDVYCDQAGAIESKAFGLEKKSRVITGVQYLPAMIILPGEWKDENIVDKFCTIANVVHLAYPDLMKGMNGGFLTTL